MTKTYTRTEVQALVDAYEAAALAQARESTAETDAALDASSEALSAIVGTGTPANEDYAESLGPDYVCALDDGTIVANGPDRSVWPGRSIRETVFITPEDQTVA